MKNKPKIIVICGPTATGKSDLAVNLAKKFDGEIISADSRQVYKGLDIGSGKITPEEMQGVPHYLLDVISPKKYFSVSSYAKLAHQKISEILEKNKLPIIVGGTGFYIDAIAQGLILPDVPPNPELRKKLQKLMIEKLQKKLKEMDPVRYAKIDIKNPMRLIRSIEIALALGKNPALKKAPKYETLYIGLDLPDEKLREKIEKRLIQRLEDGMTDEGKKLHEAGLSFLRMKSLGLEYRYLAYYLQGAMTLERITDELKSKIWQYAKRQRTWFRRNKKINWILPTDKKAAQQLAKDFLKR